MVSEIRATFKPSTDGSIHLPIPPELQGKGSLRVVAWIEADADEAKKTGSGEWAKRARGIALPRSGETSDDARFEALSRKFEAH
jgi:hypothetical protein